MVVFPTNFVAIAYPGYFWHVEEQRLYSIKVGGELRKLRFNTPNKWNQWVTSYRISHRGQSRILSLNLLKDLELSHNVMPVHGAKNMITEEQLHHIIKNLIVMREKAYYSPPKITGVLAYLKRDFDERYDVETAVRIAEKLLEER